MKFHFQVIKYSQQIMLLNELERYFYKCIKARQIIQNQNIVMPFKKKKNQITILRAGQQNYKFYCNLQFCIIYEQFTLEQTQIQD
ncbi:hypothetical protein TTHERM_000134779 (macronuclear) [Tetrahymena thermophila SB210]|uniref:Uncharacterized protein n=1 Tax=Tetrahymena thermophila (strain SB210) TaxID=312017 RepID=W7X828_TETTS|nr:hypothetical protein TTHERM_000134779 [Tetrahymena thermophila SB210]EWS73497.1 hypothetical protein TTHERM_000134779 [Tetrahymena thermophila SB210]|eukprot:XP_012653979.1 hypothetical protein TTHERM_000134779 [Tetrahymena thermophila SB210]